MICRECAATCVRCGSPVPHLERALTRKDVLNIMLAVQATDFDFAHEKVRASGVALPRTPHNFLNELALRLTRAWESPR